MKVGEGHVRRRRTPEEVDYKRGVWKVSMMKIYYIHVNVKLSMNNI